MSVHQAHPLTELFGQDVILPTLPTIYMQLTDILVKPGSSAVDIGAIVGTDPALTARILRIVNSAFYNYPSKISTVSRAVTLVGTEQLHNLALVTAVMSMFRSVPADKFNMLAFWQHSLATGVIARNIAKYLREDNIEKYFVAGLLHDIGSVLICIHKPEEILDIIDESEKKERPLYEIEREIVGFDHALAGRALLNLWDIAECHQEAVGFHHEPQLADNYPVLTSVIHIAEIMSDALQWGKSVEAVVPPMKAEAWTTLGLSVEIIPQVVQVAAQEYADALVLFGEDR